MGMVRAKRPKKAKSGDWSDYWPFRAYGRDNKYVHTRGFVRQAYIEMEATEHEPDGGWIEATLWRDNRYVTMLATTFFSAVLTTVERWTRSVGARIPRPCTLALKMYCKYIGADQGPWTG